MPTERIRRRKESPTSTLVPDKEQKLRSRPATPARAVEDQKARKQDGQTGQFGEQSGRKQHQDTLYVQLEGDPRGKTGQQGAAAKRQINRRQVGRGHQSIGLLGNDTRGRGRKWKKAQEMAAAK